MSIVHVCVGTLTEVVHLTSRITQDLERSNDGVLRGYMFPDGLFTLLIAAHGMRLPCEPIHQGIDAHPKTRQPVTGAARMSLLLNFSARSFQL